MPDHTGSVRVLFTCSGIGVINRGIESFFRDAFDGLKHTEGLDLRLLKGGGNATPGEQRVRKLLRTGRFARFLGAIVRRNGYVIEQWSSLPSVVRQVRAFRPHVIFYSDANLGFLLFRLRRHLGVPYRLLFSNGGPVHPPFVRTDYVHQIAPCYYQEALDAGESAGKHFLMPYGINLIPRPRTMDSSQLTALRRSLRIPSDRKIILSVGWISRVHKRMDYVIEEVARLPRPRPFLQLLGAIDEGSDELVRFGKRLLGPDSFAVSSVPYAEVFEYYRAADCFVLASLREGFGRVYLEALMHGLPVIAHRNSVTEYVLGSQGCLTDLSRSGALAERLTQELSQCVRPGLIRERWQSIRERFSWEVLSPGYIEMFKSCAQAHEAGVSDSLVGQAFKQHASPRGASTSTAK